MRFSCLSAGFEGFSFTFARPALLSLNDFFATVRTRAAVMFAVSVTLPVLPASPVTTIVMTPFLLTVTLPDARLVGLRDRVRDGEGRVHRADRVRDAAGHRHAGHAGIRLRALLIAWTTCDAGAPGSTARTSAATPATCGAAIEVPAIAV